MDKSPEAFRTISEVADLLDTPAHVLRFWESRFPQIRPVKRAGGRRYYRPGDVALLAGIRQLLHDDGLTIRGVQKILREQGVRHVAGLTRFAIGLPPAEMAQPPAPVPAAPDTPGLFPAGMMQDHAATTADIAQSNVVALTDWRAAEDTPAQEYPVADPDPVIEVPIAEPPFIGPDSEAPAVFAHLDPEPADFSGDFAPDKGADLLAADPAAQASLFDFGTGAALTTAPPIPVPLPDEAEGPLPVITDSAAVDADAESPGPADPPAPDLAGQPATDRPWITPQLRAAPPPDAHRRQALQRLMPRLVALQARLDARPLVLTTPEQPADNPATLPHQG